jgi:hypothetical protein
MAKSKRPFYVATVTFPGYEFRAGFRRRPTLDNIYWAMLRSEKTDGKFVNAFTKIFDKIEWDSRGKVLTTFSTRYFSDGLEVKLENIEWFRMKEV